MLKSIKKYGILILIAMVMLTSCMNKNARKNNYPVPGVDFTLPVGDVYTIDTLLYMWHAEGTHTFTQDASVYGIVVGDETTLRSGPETPKVLPDAPTRPRCR